MALEESIRELWHKNPIIVLGGGAVVVVGGYLLLHGKGASQPQAPAQDNTPVTYQIYGTPGGGGSGSGDGGVPVPQPVPGPMPLPCQPPVGGCQNGLQWNSLSCQCAPCIGPGCGPYPQPPGPNPNPNCNCANGCCNTPNEAVHCLPGYICDGHCCVPQGPPQPHPTPPGAGVSDPLTNIFATHALFA